MKIDQVACVRNSNRAARQDCPLMWRPLWRCGEKSHQPTSPQRNDEGSAVFPVAVLKVAAGCSFSFLISPS
jgi:hypothetical protein